MIKLEAIYVLMGLLTGGIAVVNARDDSNPRRWRNTLFWGVYALLFLAGSYLGDLVNGVLVLVMVGTAAAGLGQGTRETVSAADRLASALRHRNRLFVPVLVVPFATFAGSVLLKDLTLGGVPLVDPKQVTQIALGIGTVLGLVTGVVMLRPPVSAPIVEARRLMDSVGWAAVLPQSLAALGAVFATAGVGKVVSTLATTYLPLGSPVAAVVAYAVGMALFTMIMGNAFAAFPVMAAAIAVPLLIRQYGGDPAVICAIGMLAGFCGTLMTPMAANFNIVPAALLELKDRNAVVKAQVGTALPLLVVNTLFIWWFAF